MVKRLNNLGIIQRKSGYEILPPHPKKYKGSILRGIFDGDGWISYKSGTSWIYGICSASVSFLEQIRHELCFGYGHIYKYAKSECWSLNIAKRQHIKDIANFMYNDNKFSLQRKKNRFIIGDFI